MAGSYEHVLDGWSLIENMGDAYETVEELFWLVEKAIGTKEARKLLDEEFYPMKRGEKKNDVALKKVERLMGK